MSVSGGSVTETFISNLMSSTTYFTEVAAMNSAGGTGDYSNAVYISTEGAYVYVIHNSK